ncbi:MAG TPA: ATP-binding protein [Candidatus Acidoferrum sp.]|nr:ATP-binding protein [Candidatus Acidoferrum sp.]
MAHEESSLLGRLQWAWSRLRETHSKIRLRTKFLLSLVLIIAALTCTTLLVVRHVAEVQVQMHVEDDARTAILTFQVVERQRQLALSRKADLLAMLATMKNGEPAAVTAASDDPWQSDGADLLVLADPNGKIVALHESNEQFPVEKAEEMLNRSLSQKSNSGWWFDGRHLYQVALQPYYDGQPTTGKLLGTVVVGREVDVSAANDLGRISSSQVVFRFGPEIVVSTLPVLTAYELIEQTGDRSVPPEVQLGNQRYFASSVDLTPGFSPSVTLTVLKSYDESMAFLRDLNRLLLGLGVVAVLAGAGLVFLISDAFTRPLARLVEGVHALEEGNFNYPLEAHGGYEVARVTRAFNHARNILQNNEVQKQHLEEQLQQSQKMEALGRLAGGVAHDFNNLLTVIKGHSDMLLERVKPQDPIYANSEQIQKAANRAASLTRQLLAFSRRQVLQPRVVDLNALIKDMGPLLKRLTREDIEFLVHLNAELGRVKADPGQIEQVLLNLVVNASDAMPQGGKLIVESRDVSVDAELAKNRPALEPGEYVLLRVSDTGYGMDAATKARIFEPFFTTKEQGKGTGLGLAMVYGVVKQSNGFIYVESEVGVGTQFEIYLPQVNEKIEATPREKIAAPAQRSLKTILVVEDEEDVRTLVSEYLISMGYRVLTACDGTEALEIAQRLGKEIHLLLTDVVMPKMRGPELAERLKPILPKLKIIYMSGYLEQNEGNRSFLEGAYFLDKPFSRDVLARQIEEALRSSIPSRTAQPSAAQL